jgi:hypothetical protein
MVGHMAYDTQVFNAPQNGGGHIKKMAAPPTTVPKRSVSSLTNLTGGSSML